MTEMLARWFVIGFSGIVTALPVSAAQDDLGILEEAAFKQAAAVVDPSIVRIETVGGLDRIGQMLTSSAPTTGVVVSADGEIISSAFNFISKPASILVQFRDGRRYPARLIATDRVRMLTLLKIDAPDLQPIKSAEPETVRVGQWALALGRTYDLKISSVSVGVVSALNRVWGKAIQTDAKVSPVNYGGPLINVSGQAMGVLVPLSPNANGETAGVEWYDSGIGFAVPMNDVTTSAERLRAGEDLKRGYLGVTLRGRDLYANDVIIDRVRYDSPAEKAGFKPGDKIVEVNGQPVVRQAQVQHILGNRYAGDEVKVAVRRGGETLRQTVELVAELKPYESGFLGILPQRFPDGAREVNGVRVRHVYNESPAAKSGIETGDTIVACNKTKVTSAAELLDLVSRIRPGQKASISVKRGDSVDDHDVELSSIPVTIAGELMGVLIPPPNVKFDDVEESKQDPDTQDTAAETEANEENSSKEQPQETGRITGELEAHKHSFWAYVPDDYNPAWGYSLMICIHPSGDSMEATFMENWKAICDRRGIILLGPKAEKPAGWSLNESEFVHDCVQLMTERYSIDPARVTLHGYGNGGDFCWHLAFKYRDIFRGVQVIAAGLRKPPPENRPEFRLQTHLICGEKDRVIRLVKLTFSNLKRIKYPVTFSELPFQERDYPSNDNIEEAGRWVDSLDRI
jgi:serine protease Do